MAEDKEELVTLKVRDSDREWVKDEQRRIRKTGRPEPTQAEVFQALRQAYESLSSGTPAPDSGTPPKELPTSTPLDPHIAQQLRGLEDTPYWAEVLRWVGLAARAVTVRDPNWHQMLHNIETQLRQVAEIADREKPGGSRYKLEEGRSVQPGGRHKGTDELGGGRGGPEQSVAERSRKKA